MTYEGTENQPFFSFYDLLKVEKLDHGVLSIQIRPIKLDTPFPISSSLSSIGHEYHIILILKDFVNVTSNTKRN